MKHLPLLIIILCIAFTMTGYALGRLQEHKYYDGEGNEIPAKVIDLLVTSQFAHMTHYEDSVINHYFYFNDLKK
jgi:hypothetical protein